MILRRKTVRVLKEQERKCRREEAERDNREIELRLSRVRAQISVLAASQEVPMMRRAND